MELRFTPKPKLSRHLKKLDSADYASIWPHLHLISCWMDGASAPYARQLEEMFLHVKLQRKGLLATEAFVSVPIIGVEGSVLSINSHFFEFINDSGEPLLVHQIQKGKTYSVVVTTGGGFYRYQLQDVIEVIGHWKQTPRIRFVSKADHISDWFGEKLEERFVVNILENVFEAHHISPVFAMLAPENDDNRFRYVLYLEYDDCGENLATDLDKALHENFHYDYCRKLGQLRGGTGHPCNPRCRVYLYACQVRGQKLGNIKPSVLQKNIGWREWFEMKTG